MPETACITLKPLEELELVRPARHKRLLQSNQSSIGATTCRVCVDVEDVRVPIITFPKATPGVVCIGWLCISFKIGSRTIALEGSAPTGVYCAGCSPNVGTRTPTSTACATARFVLSCSSGNDAFGFVGPATFEIISHFMGRAKLDVIRVQGADGQVEAP